MERSVTPTTQDGVRGSRRPGRAATEFRQARQGTRSARAPRAVSPWLLRMDNACFVCAREDRHWCSSISTVRHGERCRRYTGRHL